MLHNPVNTHVNWLNNEGNHSKSNNCGTPFYDPGVKILHLFNFLFGCLHKYSNNIAWNHDTSKALENQSISKRLDHFFVHNLAIVKIRVERLIQSVSKAVAISHSIARAEELRENELKGLSSLVRVAQVTQACVKGQVHLPIIIPLVDLVHCWL